MFGILAEVDNRDMKVDSVISDVDLLNDVFEKSGNSMAIRPFTLITDGDGQSVEFLGQPIWDSENDERDDDDSEGSPDGRESLLSFLLREANKFLENMPKEITL